MENLHGKGEGIEKAEGDPLTMLITVKYARSFFVFHRMRSTLSPMFAVLYWQDSRKRQNWVITWESDEKSGKEWKRVTVGSEMSTEGARGGQKRRLAWHFAKPKRALLLFQKMADNCAAQQMKTSKMVTNLTAHHAPWVQWKNKDVQRMRIKSEGWSQKDAVWNMYKEGCTSRSQHKQFFEKPVNVMVWTIRN